MRTTKKDYYEILGVPRTATDKEIKAAYRKLARKHHPDVNQGDKAAEERFKEVAGAFAVLSDSEKRAKYDQGGHEAFGPEFDPFAGTGFDLRNFTFGFGDLSDLMGMFGGGPGSNRSRALRGEDIQMEVHIPFLDAVQGTTLELNLPREGACSSCDGSGVAAGASEVQCPDCHGTGQRTRKRQGMRISLTCARCQGAGRLRGTPCPSCGGAGRAPIQQRVKFRVPPGIEDGGTIRLPGKGNAGQAGGPPGDAYLITRVEPHPLFRREGRDLYCELPLGLVKVTLGGKVHVPTLDGKATITIPPGTRSGQKFRLKGRGIPASGGWAAGDLYAVIQIHPPRKIDAKSKKLLKEFARLNPDA